MSLLDLVERSPAERIFGANRRPRRHWLPTAQRLFARAGKPPGDCYRIARPADAEALVREARLAYAHGAAHLLIPFGKVDDAYAGSIAAKAADWLAGRPWAVFDARHIFKGQQWSLPFLSSQILEPMLIVATRDLDQIAALADVTPDLEALAERETIQPAIPDLYELAYKHSDYYSFACILVADDCNMACTMCMFHSKDDEYSYNDARKPGREKLQAKPEDVYRFIDSMPPGKTIVFSSAGEFFRAPEAMDYVEYAAAKKHPIYIGTNGSYLNEKIGRRLIELGVRTVTFSVDGYTEEGYEKVRVGGKWSLLIRNIETLVRLRDEMNSPLEITANCVFFDDLREKKDELLAFWSTRVDSINLMVERVDYMGLPRPGRHFVEPPEVATRPCFSPFEGPQMLSNGDISPCCEISIGEWFEDIDWLSNIKDMGIDDAMARYRKMMLDPQSPLSKHCQKCSWWSSGYYQGKQAPFNESAVFGRALPPKA